MAKRKTMLRVGDKITVRGMRCTVRKSRPAGTYDVECPGERWFRISGFSLTGAGRKR